MIKNYNDIFPRTAGAAIVEGQPVIASGNTLVIPATAAVGNCIGVADRASDISGSVQVLGHSFNGSFLAKVTGTVTAGDCLFITSSTGYWTASPTVGTLIASSSILVAKTSGVDGDLIEASWY